MTKKTFLILALVFGLFKSTHITQAAPITNLSFRFDAIGGKWVSGQYFPLYNGQNYYPENAGVFSGEIYGLLDNATSSAHSIKLTSINGLTYNFLFNMTDGKSIFSQNSFTVLNGEITSADLLVRGHMNAPSDNPAEYVSVWLNQDGVNLAYEESQERFRYPTEENKAINNNGFSGVTYTAIADPTAIPEPSTYALFGLGAVALMIAARRKRTA